MAAAPPEAPGQSETSGSRATEHVGHPRPLTLTPIFDASALVSNAAPPEAVYMDKEGVRIPLHSPYAARDWTAWNSMTKASAHRMSRDDAPLRQRADPRPNIGPFPAEQREPHDMVGWAIASMSQGQGEQADGSLTLHYTYSRPWDEPWSFRNALDGPLNEHDALGTVTSQETEHWKRVTALFFLRHPLVPLLLRLINIMLISCTLAVSARLHVTLQRNGLTSAVGVSPLTGIIFAPPSILHAMFQIWLEYRSRPIGLWLASSKLWYMMLELLFVCLWTAELALAFDNYFTSTLVCIHVGSPFYQRLYALPMPSLIPEKAHCVGSKLL